MTEARLLRRADALPESHRYEDTGCDVAPACLRCPLLMCRYDHPDGLRGVLNIGRDAEIVRRRDRGEDTMVISEAMGVGVRLVFHVLQNERRAVPRG